MFFYLLCIDTLSFVFFFFQAEDGIRDLYVTGVQTCALPISPKEGTMTLQAGDVDAFGHARLGGVGQRLAEEIEQRTGKESRAVVLGHIQRGGTPTAFDRVLATRFGLAAIDAAHDGAFGQMVALRGTDRK